MRVTLLLSCVSCPARGPGSILRRRLGGQALRFLGRWLLWRRRRLG